MERGLLEVVPCELKEQRHDGVWVHESNCGCNGTKLARRMRELAAEQGVRLSGIVDWPKDGQTKVGYLT